MNRYSQIHRGSVLVIIVGLLFAQVVNVSAAAPIIPEAAQATPPVITVWYGLNQTFGGLGSPQTWVNILGNVSDPDSTVTSLNFTLDGGSAQTLNQGPDGRRLQNKGDFNVEINKSVLTTGAHSVVIHAANSAGQQSSQTVNVQYTKNTIWPIPYSINWASINSVQSMQNALQIVDGLWSWSASGIRTVQVGYDRVLAIGDVTWGSYEVLFPVTINAVDSAAYTAPNATGPGLGVNIHWTGHTNDPVTCSQPHCGWNPTGASDWYAWAQNGNDTLAIEATPPSGSTSTTAVHFITTHTYWFRARVQDGASGNTYYLKVWENGAAEPANWTLQRLTQSGNLASGSFILVAHYVDATFGNISVTSLNTSVNTKKVYLPQVIR